MPINFFIMLEKRESYFKITESEKLRRLFFLLFFVVLVSLAFIYRFYFWPFLFALIFYMALRSLHDSIVKIVRSRMISSLIMVCLVILLILLPLFFLLLSLVNQSYEFYLFVQSRYESGQIQQMLSQSDLVRWIVSNLNMEKGEILKKVFGVLEQTYSTILANLTGILSFSVKFSINFFFMILILFFLFQDGYRLEESFYRVLPFPDDIEKDVVSRLRQVIRVLLAGNLMIMILQGLMVGLGFYIGGIQTPLLWGSVAAVLSLIPVVGTTFVWGPAVIYLAASGNYLAAIFVGFWCLVWYLLLENLVKPKVFGKKLNFHPLIFFFLLLGSLQTFGLSGIIIGPLLLTLFFSFWEIYKIINLADKPVQISLPPSEDGKQS